MKNLSSKLSTPFVIADHRYSCKGIGGKNISRITLLAAVFTVTAIFTSSFVAAQPDICASSISVSPPGDQVLCVGASVNTLTATITTTAGTTPANITYEWFSNTVNDNSTGTSIPGTQTVTTTNTLTNPFTPPSSTPGTLWYYCVVTNNDAACGSTSFATATVMVMVNPDVGTPTAITVSSGTEPACQLTNGTTTTTYATTATDNTGFNWSLSNAAAGSINATTGVMTWADGFSGTVDIRVTADGCNGPSAQVIRTVTISPTVGTPTAITVSSGTEPACQLTNGTTTTTYATTATDNTGFNWSLSNAAAGSINATTGVMTWADGFSGTVDIRVTADGCNGPSAQVIRTVTISPTVGTPTAITVSSGTEPACQLTNGTTTTTYATTATDNTGFNWSLSNAAAGSINATTGVMTWADGFSGTVDIRVTADGCNGPSAQVIRTVTISPTVGTPTAITISSGAEPACQLTNGTTTTTYATTVTDNTGFNWSLSNPAAGSINATTGVMTWADGFSGTVDIRVTADGCNGPSAQVIRTVTISPTVGTPTAITISSGAEPACQLTNGTTTTTYATTATNNTGFNWSLSNAAAGSINATTGAMTWANGFSGTVDIRVTANGCNGPSAQVIRTVTISPTVGTPTAITVSSGAEPTCQLTNGITTTTYATTAMNNTGFNWSLSNPAAGSINATTGVMTWANGFSGTVDIRVTANGCNGPSAQVIRTIAITPTVGTPTAITVSSGTQPTCQLTNGITTTTYATTAINNTGFNWSLSNPAAGSINATTGVMTWANGFSGTVDIRVTANGCNGPSTQVIRTVIITPTVGNPSFTAGLPTTRCGGAATVTYTASATNTTGITYSLDAASITGGNSINASTGAVTYAAGWFGTSTITASAAGCNGPKTVSRTVTTFAPPTAVAGTGVLTCGDPAQRTNNFPLSITSGASATNYTSVLWTSSGTGTFTNATSLTTATYTPSAADITAGSVTLTLTAFGNSPCANTTSTKTITITPAVNQNSTTWSQVPTCLGVGVQFVLTGSPTGGNGIYGYQWLRKNNCGDAGASVPVPGANGTSFIPSDFNCYWLQVTSGGCTVPPNLVSTTQRDRPRNSVSDSANIGFAGINAICIGGSTTLTASSSGVNYTYTWSPATGLSTTTGPTVIASPTTTTTYTVTGTSVNDPGCSRTSTITVTVNPLATLSTLSTTATCDGTNETITLNGLLPNTTSSITYQIESGTPVTINNVVSNGSGVATFTIPVTYANNGQVLTVTSVSSRIGSGPSCSQTFSGKTVTLLVNQRPTATISGTQVLCNGTPATITVTLTGTFPWSLTYTDGTTSTTVNGITSSPYTFNVTPATTRTYTITALSDSRCSAIPSGITGSATVTVPSGAAGVWTGANNNDWFNCQNWANGSVPTTAVDVTIPGTAVNLCKIDATSPLAGAFAGVAKCRNIAIDNKTLLFGATSDSLLVAGNLTIQNNGTLDMTSGGGLELQGNWNNLVINGSNGFKYGTGLVNFTGSITQTMSSVNATEIFYNVQINKSAERVNLNKNLTVNRNLVLTKGIFVTNNNLFTWSNSGGTLTSPNTPWLPANTTYSDSYICTCNGSGVEITSTGNNGFRINSVSGNSDVYFPVGTDFVSANRMALKMNNFGTADFTVVVGKGDLLNTPSPRVNRIWYVNSSVTDTTVIRATMKLFFTKRDWSTYQFLVDQDEIEAGYAYNDNHLIQKDYNGAFYNNSGSNDILDYLSAGFPYNTELFGLYTIFVSPDLYGNKNGIIKFSRFSVVNAKDIILPVSIVDFKAAQQGPGVGLEWKALNEINIDHYEIQRSTNGITFSTISSMPARNNNNPVNKYTGVDVKPSVGNNFYRIKVTEKSDRVNYTEVVVVNINAGFSSIRFYPNPVINKALNIQMNNMPAAKYTLSLYNIAGQKVFERIIEHPGGAASQQIILPQGLANGGYLLRLFNETTYITTKLVID